MSAYGTSLVKRHRATKVEIAQRRRVLLEIIAADGPMSVRQAYYRAVVAGIVPKTDAGYQRVQREILNMRRGGELDYDSIVDNTRWMRKPRTWDSAAEALASTAAFYRQALWSRSESRVEVWCESDSIAGSIGSVTETWDVPLMPTRGFSSETFAYNAAEAWAQDTGRPVVLYVGDHDPHGLEIEQALRNRLRTFYSEALGRKTKDPFMFFFGDLFLDLPGIEFDWRRIGVTWQQVLDLDLPGTKPKKPYGYPIAVEAEALPPQMLRDLLDEAIREYVDEEQLETLRAAEESEREVLGRLVEAAGGKP